MVRMSRVSSVPLPFSLSSPPVVSTTPYGLFQRPITATPYPNRSRTLEEDGQLIRLVNAQGPKNWCVGDGAELSPMARRNSRRVALIYPLPTCVLSAQDLDSRNARRGPQAQRQILQVGVGGRGG